MVDSCSFLREMLMIVWVAASDLPSRFFMWSVMFPFVLKVIHRYLEVFVFSRFCPPSLQLIMPFCLVFI